MIKLGNNATKLINQHLNRVPLTFTTEELEYQGGWCISLACDWNEDLFRELCRKWPKFSEAVAEEPPQVLTFGFAPDLTCKVMLDNGKNIFFAEDIKTSFINSNKVCRKWLSDLLNMSVLVEIDIIITFNK